MMQQITIISTTFAETCRAIMKRIYNILSVVLVAFVLFSCSSKEEQQENVLLARARTEFEKGNYNAARRLIDSIRVVSPTETRILREAEILRREAMIKEKERDVAFFEEELQRLVSERDELAAKFVFDKRSGFYTVKSQDLSKNTKNNFLKASVDKDGVMYLTSFYRGSKKIKHKTLKLSSNGIYVSCDRVAYERNEKSSERRDYKYGEDDGLVDFIYATKTGKIEVELSGDKGKATYTLRDSDAAAVRSILELRHAIVAVRETEEKLKESKFYIGCLKGGTGVSGDSY